MNFSTPVGLFAILLSASASASTLQAEVDQMLSESEADYAEDVGATDAAELVAIERDQIQAMVSDQKADRATVRGFLSQYRASKKEYRSWKREHRSEAKSFLGNVARLRRQMRRHPETFPELASMKAECGQSSTCAAERMSTVLQANVPGTEKQRTSVCTVYGDNGGSSAVSWHLLVYGQSECEGDADVMIRTVGAGLYAGFAESNVYFCTGDTTGKTIVGPYAQAAFGYFGTRLGFLFGGAGACVNFNYSFGFGGSAGLQIVSFR
jgi:hypothetical protein